MMTPTDGLTSTDLDLEQQLRSYRKKINTLRKAGGGTDMDAGGLTSPKAERRQRRKRMRQLRSTAEDYRRARLAQRIVQAICGAQIGSTLVLAALANAAFAATLIGNGFGMAASFARVQKHHAICMVFNVAYLIASVAEPFALLLTLVHSHTPEGLVRKLPKRHPLGVIVMGVIATVASILGVLAAAYVLARPLELHRYESVALDEETADSRARKGGTHGALELGRGGEDDDDDDDDDEPQRIQPMEAWLNAGEIGVPLVFMPVTKPTKPKHWSQETIVSLPTLPPPPEREASRPSPPTAVRAEAPDDAKDARGAAAEAVDAAPAEEEGFSVRAAAPRLPASGDSVAALMHEDEEDEEAPAAAAPMAAAPASTAAAPTAAPAAAGSGAAPGSVAAAPAAAAPVADDDDSDDDELFGEDGGGDGEAAAADEKPKGGSEGAAVAVPAALTATAAGAGGDAGGGGGGGGEGSTLRERMRQKASGLKEAAVDAAAKLVADGGPQTAEEMFERAKALNKQGKYKQAVDLIEDAYALQPKISTALSAANLRLKLGNFDKAASAYRKVISAAAAASGGEGGGPSEGELAMARSKLREAEEGLRRASAEAMSPIERRGVPRPIEWYAAQLEELSEELFSESASLYDEFGVQLQDGLREVNRHLRAHRLLAAGQTLRPVEKMITQACLSQRDGQERSWLTTVRALLNELRVRCQEVQTALKELDEVSGATGWRPASDTMGIKTEWKQSASADDNSLWIKMEGELTGASLVHAAAVAYEVELWPRWVPLCSCAEALCELDPMERVTHLQFDLPMLKRGAVLHWSLADNLVERQTLLLLGVSVEEQPSIERPPSAQGVALAEFKAIKVVVRPRTATSASIRWVMNLDLKANMPQPIISMVTKKIAGAILSLLLREAQRVTAAKEGGAAANAAAAEPNPYLRAIEQRPDLYGTVEGLFAKYFDLYGEEEEAEEAAAE